MSADRRPANGQPPETRNTVTMPRRLFGALAIAVVLPLTLATQLPASGSTVASSKSLAKDLLPSSYAKEAGFTEVAEKVTTSKTGSASCPEDAAEAFRNAAGKMNLITEAVACITSQGAATLLKGARSATSATSARPPKQLGSSAIERSSPGPGSIYQIYWVRGLTLEVVELTTDVSAGSSGTRHKITSAQQKVLSSAAVEQNGLPG